MFLMLLFLSAFAGTFASDFFVSCYQATFQDIPKLFSLIDIIGKDDESDLEKVVKLSNRFIEKSLQEDIKNQKLFIAFDHRDGRMVGYKKLFIIDNVRESHDIMCNKIRCMGDKSFKVDYAMINSADICFLRTSINEHIPFVQHELDLCVYIGSDYVMPALRNQGIGKKLHAYSLSILFKALVKSNIDNYKRLVLLYGFSQYNDFGMQDEGICSTSSIVCSIVSALKKLNILINPLIQHYRFQTCKPAFIDNGQDCILLPDGQGVADYGNVLVFTLKKD